jgi:hypothetical protein
VNQPQTQVELPCAKSQAEQSTLQSKLLNPDVQAWSSKLQALAGREEEKATRSLCGDGGKTLDAIVDKSGEILKAVRIIHTPDATTFQTDRKQTNLRPRMLFKGRTV